MAIITGTLTDVGLDSIAGVLTRLEFEASEPFLEGSAIRVGSSAAVLTGESWTADLAPTMAGVFYRIRAHWTDEHGRKWIQELDNVRLNVPAGGGSIGELPGVPLAPEYVWVGESPPVDRTRWWLDSTTGLLKRWVA